KTLNGEYLVEGVTADGFDRLWGLPVIQSAALAQGTAIVGDFAGSGVIWQRQESIVAWAQMGTSEDSRDLFSHNLLRARGEERMALAVTRPAGFAVVSNLTAAPEDEL